MFIYNNTIGIIADDLTGANDTALQFFEKGCSTEVLLDIDNYKSNGTQTQVLAVATQTRNSDEQFAKERVDVSAKKFINDYNIEHFYKKIDSTLRGNIAVEIMTMLENIKAEAALIAPAFPNEGRTTVGGYHLLKGFPIQLTELAKDPMFPVGESNIVNILRKQLPEKQQNIVGLIELDTVMKGAGPISAKIDELINNGKKLIVVDAVLTTDIEQIVLAFKKNSHPLLPCGSAGMAQALRNIWISEEDINENEKHIIPKLPKLIISGSATEISASQLQRLKESEDIDNTYFIPLKLNDIFDNNNFDIIEQAVNHLVNNNVVVIHSSDLIDDPKELQRQLFENEITKNDFLTMICDKLSQITKEILLKKEAILITIGGETSYKCCKAIDSENIRLIDKVAPAIPLGINHNGQLIVTKSGNLGYQKVLIDIIKYLDQEI